MSVVSPAEDALRCTKSSPLLSLPLNGPRLYSWPHWRYKKTQRPPAKTFHPCTVNLCLPGFFFIIQFRVYWFRYSASAVASPLDHRSGFHTPASREREYSPAAGNASFDTSIDSLPESSTFREPRRSQTADHHGPESQQLSPNDMIAPVSAVHSMSVNLLGSDDVSCKNIHAKWS